MSLPRDISPGARARRSLLFDLLAALVLAAAVIVLCAGIGVVGFVAVLSLLLLLIWFGVEQMMRARRRRQGTRISSR